MEKETENQDPNPKEATLAALDGVHELLERLRPILAGLETHQDDGRQLAVLFKGYLAAIEAELKGLLKFAAGVEFEEEEEVDDEPLWDGPAEAAQVALDNLRELGKSLGPILDELETRHGPDRQLGESIAELLRDVEWKLRAVLEHEKGQADA